jgi:transcriptional regulator with XRE-family HTH domain
MSTDATAGKRSTVSLKVNTRLKYHRQMRHLTQAQLAEELYALCSRKERDRGIINAGMIGGWERGEHAPSAFWQKKLCALFETTPDELGLVEVTSPLAHVAVQQHEPTRLPHPLLDTTSYPILANYLQQQRRLLADALAPGSHSLRVGDIVDDSRLFIPLPWISTQGTEASQDLVEYLIEALLRGQRLLMLGDAGQGKTTVLKQIFVRLVDRFLEAPTPDHQLPIYLPLREFTSFTGNALDLLWTQLGEDFPLTYEQFTTLVRNKRILFLFDGFDEIRGEITQRSINDRAICKVFTYPSLLSCRKGFFEFYLSMSTLIECYPYQIELQPLTLTGPVIDYITAFCQQKQGGRQRLSSPQKIVETIQMNQVLLDLAQRPLLLLMILEVFTDPKEMDEGQWSITKLYQKYTKGWLRREAAKPDSVLKWNEKATLLQEVAWFSYMERSASSSAYYMRQHIAMTHAELWAFAQSIAFRFPGVTDHQLFDDLCFRTLLGISEGETYAFLHKSLQEYYVARYVFECMHGRDLEAIERVLQTSLPFDVALFLKDILKESGSYEKSLVTGNLINVYQRHRTDDQRSITIRQQASHYLTSLGIEPAIRFLEQICGEEPNKWVQRGIMVGLALYSSRAPMLENYIRIIREDQEAAAINLSYHLIYYSDQEQRVDAALQRVDQCDNTVKALFRHLREDRYKNGWSLDILTLSTLLERRGMSILQAQTWQIPFLKNFLRKDHSELGDIFQQEKDRLQRLLEGEQSWN